MIEYNKISKTFDFQESLFSGDYTQINGGLGEYVVRLGNEFRWIPKETLNNEITFETPVSSLIGREIVKVNFESREIKIDSYSKEKLIWNKKQLKKNEENCNNVVRKLPDYISKYLNSDVLKMELEKRKKNEIKLNDFIISTISDLDKDGNGEVDVVEGDDFNLLLRKHQNKITEIDRNYIQEFVKISSYLKSKKENIQKIFDSIKDSPNEEILNYYVQILKGDIHSYNLLLFNSLNMIVSLVEDDMITFYEIHERFDNLNIFDSKHERDVSLKLSNIGDGLKELMFSIEEMGRNIEDQLSDLSYITEQSSLSLNSQLEQIDSSLKTNNLLTTINTYQTYKLRK